VTKKRTFEDDLAKLEDLVRRLEEDELGLEESIEAFEEGMKIAGTLTRALEKAQARVQRLARDDQGEFALHELETGDGEDDDADA
jgi:exodeoxyribonuclease VII small subunit